jgi:hypothetical protein
VNHCRLLFQAAQSAGVCEQLFVQDQGGSHMHGSMQFMHIVQKRVGPRLTLAL